MKDIPGYEGKYAITKDGRVWSHPKTWHNDKNATNGHNGKFLKPGKGTRGYLHVALKDPDGKFRSKRIHRLVAITYLPNLNNLREVNHKDNNPANNNVTNLEWCTSYHNLYQRNETSDWRQSAQDRFNDMVNAEIPIETALYAVQ